MRNAEAEFVQMSLKSILTKWKDQHIMPVFNMLPALLANNPDLKDKYHFTKAGLPDMQGDACNSEGCIDTTLWSSRPTLSTNDGNQGSSSSSSSGVSSSGGSTGSSDAGSSDEQGHSVSVEEEKESEEEDWNCEEGTGNSYVPQSSEPLSPIAHILNEAAVSIQLEEPTPKKKKKKKKKKNKPCGVLLESADGNISEEGYTSHGAYDLSEFRRANDKPDAFTKKEKINLPWKKIGSIGDNMIYMYDHPNHTDFSISDEAGMIRNVMFQVTEATEPGGITVVKFLNLYLENTFSEEYDFFVSLFQIIKSTRGGKIIIGAGRSCPGEVMLSNIPGIRMCKSIYHARINSLTQQSKDIFDNRKNRLNAPFQLTGSEESEIKQLENEAKALKGLYYFYTSAKKRKRSLGNCEESPKKKIK